MLECRGSVFGGLSGSWRCCVVGPNQTDYPFYTEARKQKAIDLLFALNSKISTSIGQVKALNQDYNDRLDFVDAAGSNSPFIGHDICSSDPFFYGLILQNTTSSFHSNAAGQEAYADLVRAKLGV